MADNQSPALPVRQLIWIATPDSNSDAWIEGGDSVAAAYNIDRGVSVCLIEYTEVTWPDGLKGCAHVRRWRDRALPEEENGG